MYSVRHSCVYNLVVHLVSCERSYLSGWGCELGALGYGFEPGGLWIGLWSSCVFQPQIP